MSSLRQTIALLLKDYANLIKQLFESIQSISSSNQTQAGPTDGSGAKQQTMPHQIMAQIIEKDRSLQKALRDLEEHQILQQKIIVLQSE
eukprot:CAMPEP_0184361954 /NCGR_PEP_ID=MMETSP1089-20130417/132599_1 /TAXON_ID=38269 ORGANISM="Gloeochaete wittrockiana, Strain SAG46.84" /NCGR_SAMPLE_ID=MMETSP1089 /ASSEMBLY_ACC=CAM_ASM_000445 /LENGTH=88 /DNA_ID=CAMNT_0026701825 /DNA_START=26 /DNA_END=289 /DNA_ORIENTATION=+